MHDFDLYLESCSSAQYIFIFFYDNVCVLYALCLFVHSTFCHCRREKNFHILYYLMAGLSSRKQLAKYKLKGAHHHRYLEQRGTGKGSAKRNVIFSERFDQIEKIFYLFGFTQEVCFMAHITRNCGLWL